MEIEAGYRIRAGARPRSTRPGRGDLRVRPEVVRRTLVLAPHPDDDTLAAGGLLRWAAAAGASVRVLYLTDGENNPWAQRAVERRIRLGAADRVRWGARRRLEAIESLGRLGVPPASATFLGLPDQHLTDVLVASPEELVAPLADAIADWKPTLLLAPSLRDRHPDHGAAAIATRAALARIPEREQPLALAYGIHGPAADVCPDAGWTLALDVRQRDAKRAALLAHGSQLVWHRRTFLAAAGPGERFADALALGDAYASAPDGCALRVEPGGWTFELRPGLRGALGGRELLVAALVHGTVAASRIPFPAPEPRASSVGNGHAVSGTMASGWRGALLRATLTGPPPSASAQWFVKVALTREQRLGFMDRWPWLAVSIPAVFADGPPHGRIARLAHAGDGVAGRPEHARDREHAGR